MICSSGTVHGRACERRHGRPWSSTAPAIVDQVSVMTSYMDGPIDAFMASSYGSWGRVRARVKVKVRIRIGHGFVHEGPMDAAMDTSMDEPMNAATDASKDAPMAASMGLSMSEAMFNRDQHGIVEGTAHGPMLPVIVYVMVDHCRPWARPWSPIVDHGPGRGRP